MNIAQRQMQEASFQEALCQCSPDYSTQPAFSFPTSRFELRRVPHIPFGTMVSIDYSLLRSILVMAWFGLMPAFALYITLRYQLLGSILSPEFLWSSFLFIQTAILLGVYFIVAYVLSDTFGHLPCGYDLLRQPPEQALHGTDWGMADLLDHCVFPSLSAVNVLPRC